MKRIAILGSTGSIGRSTLNIVASYPDRFAVTSLAAGSNLELIYEQTLRWKPRLVSLLVSAMLIACANDCVTRAIRTWKLFWRRRLGPRGHSSRC